MSPGPERACALTCPRLPPTCPVGPFFRPGPHAVSHVTSGRAMASMSPVWNVSRAFAFEDPDSLEGRVRWSFLVMWEETFPVGAVHKAASSRSVHRGPGRGAVRPLVSFSGIALSVTVPVASLRAYYRPACNERAIRGRDLELVNSLLPIKLRPRAFAPSGDLG